MILAPNQGHDFFVSAPNWFCTSKLRQSEPDLPSPAGPDPGWEIVLQGTRRAQ